MTINRSTMCSRIYGYLKVRESLVHVKSVKTINASGTRVWNLLYFAPVERPGFYNAS